MSSTETLGSVATIKARTTTSIPYYCTETEWREYSGYTNTSDFPTTEVATHLKNATEQVKKDAFYMVRNERVTKDSSGRYFTSRRYWANRYDRDDSAIEITCGEVTPYDIEVHEADTTSSAASSLVLQGGRINRIMYNIPYEGITEVDPLNCYFKLSSEYPTNSRQVYVTYWVAGKPLDELHYALKRACMEMVTVLALKKLKGKRLKKGTTQYTLGKQTIVRNEEAFDELVKQKMNDYYTWINWMKPFIGRRLRIGNQETYNNRVFRYRY